MYRLAYYLIVIEGTDFELRGPYSKPTRDQTAKMFMARSLDTRMFALDILDGTPKLYEISIEFFRGQLKKTSAPTGDGTLSG